MTKKIYKYRLQVTPLQYVAMPAGAQLLSVQMQGDTPYLWALVDTDQRGDSRPIQMIGTGHDAGGIVGRHLGTVQVGNPFAPFVWHFFDGAPR